MCPHFQRSQALLALSMQPLEVDNPIAGRGVAGSVASLASGRGLSFGGPPGGAGPIQQGQALLYRVRRRSRPEKETGA